ncbi:MAG TPA: pyridoxamine 5'-phosphate oxidase family protein [Chloroflexota bacterium]|nr:pyridoxamine 5'-phosphate oxidase family protein [Chloroflexota bacterium]
MSVADLPFAEVIDSLDGLRSLYPPPSARAVAKQIPSLDAHCRALIAVAPFVLIGTSNAAGDCDVSPKGGPPGFVRVLDDHRLAWADLPGNRRVDSMRNLLDNPRIGLLFLIPGMEETLRVNGRAWPTRDPAVLEAVAIDGQRPPLGIGVQVEEAFIHCAKAFLRAKLWNPELWPDRSALPTAACILRDHARITEFSVGEIEASLRQSHRDGLYWPQPTG